MMRRWGSLLTCLVLLVLGTPEAVAAADQERIVNYVVSGDVRTDGIVVVTERIRYHFTEPRHGIFRFIPLYYPLLRADGSVNHLDSRKIEVTDYSATMDGRAVPFVEDTAARNAADNSVLRVGDEHREVTGEHDYRLEYRIHGLLNAPGGQPELFWDALGGASEVPVDHAEVTVSAPGPIGRVRCVIAGVTSATTRVGQDSVRFVADRIGANTALSVTAALPDTVVVPPPVLRSARNFGARLVDNLLSPGREVGMPLPAAVVVTIVEFVLGALSALVLYRPQRRGTAQPSPTRAQPPAGVPAALCGIILRGRVDRGAAAAVLTDMAVRGVVHVTEVDGGFEVAWTGGVRNILDTVPDYERPIVGALADPVTMTGNREDAAEFARALSYLPMELADAAVRGGWFTRTPPDPAKVRRTGLVVMAFSVIAIVVAGLGGLAWWLVPLGLAGLVLYRRPYLALRGRTALGSTARSELLGFREYLRSVRVGGFAEDDPRRVFDRYLPYALALGLGEHWVGRFAAAGITPGHWYADGTIGAGCLVFAATTNSMSTSPIIAGSGTGSSSFTSSSGFSGGGTGGGGGGGVGSW